MVLFILNFDSECYGVFLIELLEQGVNMYEFGVCYDEMKVDIIGCEFNNIIYCNIIEFKNVIVMIGYKRQINKGIFFRINFGIVWCFLNVVELY